MANKVEWLVPLLNVEIREPSYAGDSYHSFSMVGG